MERPTPSQARTAVGLLLLLAALTLALFWPATGYDYVKLDDDQYVAGNPHVQTGLTPANVRWAFTAVYEDWWLPLLWLSFMLDAELFGPGPFGYHLANILLHAANASLLFWFLFRATGSRWRSFLVAALFAVHPLRVESVAWITARKDVLSGLFFFLALLAYLRHAARPSAARLGGVAVLMLLGLATKAILIVLPPLLLLLDYWPLRRADAPGTDSGWRRWRPLLLEKLPLFGLALLFVAVNVRTHWTGGDVTFADLPLATRIGLVPPNYWAYLRLVFWPARLSILYPEHDVVDWTVSTVAAAGLGAITLLLFRCRRKAPYGIVGWLWFLLALAPVIRGVRGPGLAAYADRYVYLPSIGLAFALVWGLAAFSKVGHAGNRRANMILGTMAWVAVAGMALLSRRQTAVWKSSETVFLHALAVREDNALAHRNLGAWYATERRLDEAARHLKRSLEIQPRCNEAYFNLGNIYLERGDKAGAIRSYRAMVADNPRHAQALNNLAYLLATDPAATKEQAEEALTLAKRALECAKEPDAAMRDTLAKAREARARSISRDGGTYRNGAAGRQ